MPNVSSSASFSQLKAVIPSSSQSNLLDSIIFGQSHSSLSYSYDNDHDNDYKFHQSLEKSEEQSKKKNEKKQRPKSGSGRPGWRHPFIGLSLNLDRDDYLPSNVKKKLREEQEHLETMKIASRKGAKVRKINGQPVYATISQHKIEWDKRQKEREDEVIKKERVFKTLVCNRDFNVKDKDGIQYVFDYNGTKLREDEYQSKLKLEKEKEERKLARKGTDESLKLYKLHETKWSGLILERTQHQLEVLEHTKLVEEKFKDRTWKPLKLPSTTFSMYNMKTNKRTKSLPGCLVRHWPGNTNINSTINNSNTYILIL